MSNKKTQRKSFLNLELTSGTWKSNLIYVGMGIALIYISNLVGGAISSGFGILGLILFFVGLLHLVVIFFRYITHK